MTTLQKLSNGDVKIKFDQFKSKNVDFEDALEQTGFGKYNIALIIVCGISLFATNTEAYSVGFIVPSTECEWNLDNYTKGILTSANVLGILGTCIIWGCLSDIKGRKNLLVITFFLSFLTSVAAALASSFWVFVILRFINGICMSGPSAIIFAYFGEFQGQNKRSKAISYVSLFIAAALICLPGFGWLILPTKIEWNILGIRINSWRLFMLINAISNFLASVGLSQFPESPKFLYYSGKLDESLSVLRKIYASNTGQPESNFPVESLNDKILLEKDGQNINMWMNVWKQILELFRPPHWIYTGAGCFMQAGVFAISSGLFLWYPDIINQLSGQNESKTICEALASRKIDNENLGTLCQEIDDNVFIQNLIIGITYFIGYGMWGVFVNALGNKNFFNACMIISSIGTIVLSFISEKIVIDILFVIVLTVPGICVAVINASIVNIIPTHLCGMAICVVMTAGRLGSMISSSIVGIMLEFSCQTTFFLYAASLIVCLFLSMLFPKK